MNKTKSKLFEKCNKIDKPLMRPLMEQRWEKERKRDAKEKNKRIEIQKTIK